MGKSCSAHGGVAKYLHKNYNFKVIDLCINSSIWDGQIIEIFEESNLVKNTKKMFLCNIFRPPVQTSENIATFISEMTELFQKFRNHDNLILTGDFNINLFEYNETNSINDFLEFILSFGYIPKITFQLD